MANIDLFSYFPGLEVGPDEVMRAELLAYQVLSAKYPDMDLREGTAVRDMIIRPNATLLALISKALLLYFTQNTVTGITNETSPVFVDKLMSNWFISRKQGNNSVINVRLFFSKSKNVSIFPDVYFSTDGLIKFYPEVSQIFVPSNLTFDSASNQYYIDIDLVAEKAGSAYDISSGSLLYFTNFDPYFMHGEINFLKSTSVDVESNTDFITRTKSAISTRNLINTPSIVSNLLENFSYISDIIVKGFGDPGMIRDKIKVLPESFVDPIWIHNGGCVDIYCNTDLSSSILQFELDDTGKVELSGAIYKVNRSFVSGGVSEDTVPPKQQPITAMTWGTGNLTITTTEHEYLVGDSITISDILPVECTGTFEVTSVLDETSFTVLLVTDPGTITLGENPEISFDNDYSISYPAVTTKPVTGITSSAGTATLVSDGHGLEIGERVYITGVDTLTPGYDGVRTILSAPSVNTVTFEVESGISSPAAGSIEISYVDRNKEVGFSERQAMVLDFGVRNANRTVSLVLSFFENLTSISAYLEDKANRVLCADLLARGFNLTSLDFVVTSYTGFSPDVAVCNTIISTYLSSLAPGQAFIMSDLLSQLYAGGITTIKTPLEVTYTKYWNDLLGNTTGVILDRLNPEDSINIFVLNSVTTTFESV